MKFYYTVLLLLITTFTFAQNKRLQEKANGLYKNEQYAEAIPLYQELLAEQANLATKTKLAYCYRVNNNLVEAEKLYADIVQNDKAKSITWFYYGETLMGNGKYEEAKKWLEDYQQMEVDDERAALLIRACEEVPNIQPYFPYVLIKEFPYNSEADDNSAVIFDGQIIFSSDRKQGVKLLKEKSGWTGRDYLRLYSSLVSEDGSKMTRAEPYSSRLTELNKNTGNATFTADGTEVYFTKNNNEVSKRNAYNLQIFRATSEGDEKWKDIEKMTFCSGEYNYMHPAISPDGKYLFFVSDKPRGQGGTDIYWTKRRSDGIWGKVQNLGDVINTPSHEGFPFFNKEGELYFCSKGHIGYGGFDIFMTQLQRNGEWTTPTNLGKPINSSLDDISIYLNEEKNRGLFTSSRANGDDDIYLFDVGRSPIAPYHQPLVQNEVVAEKNTPTVTPMIENQALLETLQQPATTTLSEASTETIIEENTSESLALSSDEMSHTNAEVTTTEVITPQEEETLITDVTTFLPNENTEETLEVTAFDATDVKAEDMEEQALETMDATTTFDSNINDVEVENEESIITEADALPLADTIAEVDEQMIENEILMQVDSAVQANLALAENTMIVENNSTAEEEMVVEESIEQPVTQAFDNQTSTEEEMIIPPTTETTTIVTNTSTAPSSMVIDQLTTQLNSQDYAFEQNITLEKISYAPTSIKPDDYQTLDRLVSFLQEFPQVEIELGAHTIGDREEAPRRKLTEMRAYAAAAYLVENGVQNRRIVPRGYGSSRLGEDVLTIKILAF